MWLIQGFFLQQQLRFDSDIIPAARITTADQGMLPFMFAGVIHRFHDKADVFVGEMQDQFGPSKLFDIYFDDVKGIYFKKQYLKHEMLGEEKCITYAFSRREGNTWVGKYSFPKSYGEDGLARCILTEVDDKLFIGDLDRYLAQEGSNFVRERQAMDDLENSL